MFLTAVKVHYDPLVDEMQDIFFFFSFRLRTERFRQWLKLCPNVRRIQSKSLFWISLLPACAHTLTLSEDKVEIIQSHIWSFCKIPLHLFLS